LISATGGGQSWGALYPKLVRHFAPRFPFRSLSAGLFFVKRLARGTVRGSDSIRITSNAPDRSLF
jgi:hypothetical protein